MKPKQTFLAVCAFTALIFAQNKKLYAQAWSINGNAGIASGTNYLGTSDPNDLVFRSNAIERGRLLGTTGEWRFGTATNYLSVDVNGRVRFTGPQAAYQVAGNKYAFQYSGDPDYGLFFNSTAVQYEFRNGSAVPVFLVNANTGASTFSGALTVGAYTLPATDGSNNQVLKTNGSGILNWANDNNTTYSAGTGLSLAGTTFTNTAPDQVVTVAGSNGITTSGSYPNFTVSGTNLWRTNGNAGTTPASNFIGTTDAQSLVFRTNNTEKLRLATDGKTGIGTAAPTARLHINGASGEDALRIQTNGTTRLFVDDAGGVSIGSLTPGPAGGMFINGTLGVGIASPAFKVQIGGDGTGLGFDGGQYIRDVAGAGFSDIEVHANFVPDNTNSHALGSSTNEWSEVWAVDGSINLTGTSSTRNVKNLPYGMNEIMKMRPVIYNRINNPEGGDGVKRLGLIAEELKAVVPEAVKDWTYTADHLTNKMQKVPSSKIGVNMDNIIPVLIKGMQEQQREIDELKALVARLSQNNSTVVSGSQNEAVTGATLSSATLEQNIPNPLNGSTSIRYNIPNGARSASLLITDLNGKNIRQIPLNKIGAGIVHIDAATLSNGTYNYTLLIDGRQIETKKMVIAR